MKHTKIVAITLAAMLMSSMSISAYATESITTPAGTEVNITDTTKITDFTSDEELNTALENEVEEITELLDGSNTDEITDDTTDKEPNPEEKISEEPVQDTTGHKGEISSTKDERAEFRRQRLEKRDAKIVAAQEKRKSRLQLRDKKIELLNSLKELRTQIRTSDEQNHDELVAKFNEILKQIKEIKNLRP